MTKRNNSTLLDISKVQHGTFYYVNQYGQVTATLKFSFTMTGDVLFPVEDTIRMSPVHRELLAHPHPDYIGETEYQRAVRLNLLDHWTPVVTFQLTANHNIQFTGDKAVKMWELWKAKIYGKRK